jgi:hypothetical protein
VADVPLRVPDQYAAAAQEEARFEKVTAPRIARAQVTIADTTNSSAEGLLDQLGFQVPATSTLTIVSDKSTGSGTVLSLPAGIDCVVNGDSTSGTCSVDSTRPLAVQLIETPASGSAFTRWSGPVASGCAPTGTCVVSLDSPLLVWIRRNGYQQSLRDRLRHAVQRQLSRRLADHAHGNPPIGVRHLEQLSKPPRKCVHGDDDPGPKRASDVRVSIGDVEVGRYPDHANPPHERISARVTAAVRRRCPPVRSAARRPAVSSR